jgi:hypothetical protein
MQRAGCTVGAWCRAWVAVHEPPCGCY